VSSPLRPSLMTAPVVQIPVPGLADIFDAVEKADKAEEDNSHLPLQPTVKLVIEPRYELPSALDMPQKLRCDFCLKYDSICFNCHKKWRDIEIPQRRTALLSRFSELPEGAKIALFFTSCARGDVEFVKMVLGAYPNGGVACTKWISELHPTKLDLFQIFKSNKSHIHEELLTTGGDLLMNEDSLLQDSWDEVFIKPTTDMESHPPPKFLRPGLLRFIGRHTALHVAVAYDSLEIAKLLIEASPSLVRSEKKLLPFQLLPENPFRKEDGSDDDDDDEQQKAETSAKNADKKKEQEEDEQPTLTKIEGDHQEQAEESSPSTMAAREEQIKSRIREWHHAFTRKPQIAELILANEARKLRTQKKWELAEKVYDKLLKKNARNEHALCGRAKMYFDQGRYDDCIRQCRDVLSLDMFGGVQWIDFDSNTIHYLMESALKVIHDRAHAVEGPTLKSCGCVHTARVKLNLLTKMKQEDFARLVCPFVDVQTCFILARAFSDKTKTFTKRNHLGRVVVRTLQIYVSSLSPKDLTPQLYSNPNIAAVLNQLRFQLPKENANKWLPPFTSRGFTVVAFCDFQKILVKTIVEAYNPAFKKSVFARFKKNTPELIAVVKEFEIRAIEPSSNGDNDNDNKDSAPTAWTMIDSSDWEVDETIHMAPQAK
jgi:tetratricopeptide (TPR) repeat protein